MENNARAKTYMLDTLKYSVHEQIDMMHRFTTTHESYKNADVQVKELACLRIQFPFIMGTIQDGDFFAGDINYLPIGLLPQFSSSLGYYYNTKQLEAYYNSISDDTYIKKLDAIVAYWEQENTPKKIRDAYPLSMKKALFSDNWTVERGVAFPLYRLAGTQMDFGKLLQYGVDGFIGLIETKKSNQESSLLYDCMIDALHLFQTVCEEYHKQATHLAEYTKYPNMKSHYKKLSNALSHIAHKKPTTFFEAVQLMLLYWFVSGSHNLGRADVYFGDFVAHDLQCGRITESEALQIVVALYTSVNKLHEVFDTRINVGGKGRKNEKNADIFAKLAIQATMQLKEAIPQLSLRIYQGMDSSVYDLALQSIGERRTYPMLYNDDVNIPAVMKAFDISYEEALDYSPYGCGEYILFGKSLGTPSGVINLLKALEVTLYNGKDLATGEQLGLDLGNIYSYATFDELYEAYAKQVEYFIEHLAEQERLEYDIMGQEASCLYLSMLYDDCIKKEKALLSGGVKYLGGVVETYGNTNTADSLLAIKQAVFEDKTITKKRLIEALQSNFKGFEAERKILKKVHKYGNDYEDADTMLCRVHKDICEVTKKQSQRVGLSSYLVVVINNEANTILGRGTSASADGRYAGQYLANANNPFPGCDTKGITAMLNSLVKISNDNHAGATQNIKFAQKMFHKELGMTKVLLSTYFEQGGTQAMISVINKKDLEDALIHPEAHRDIIVRVGGFSARFVELDKDVQMEVFHRTVYGA